MINEKTMQNRMKCRQKGLGLKSCKKSSVPDDYKDVLLSLFKKAVEDGKITSIGVKKNDLIKLTNEAYKLEKIGAYTVFQSSSNRFYVKNNKIEKIVRVQRIEI